jgi:geranylgeranyl pyrophosphate synthase
LIPLPAAGSPTGLPARLADWRAAVDAELADIAANAAEAANAAGDRGGNAGGARSAGGADDRVAEALGYALSAGGKRLRPILCLGAAEAVDAMTPGRSATADSRPPRMRVRAAAAIEMIHTYSLVHDDLPCMDDDPLRRGRPTTHRVCGTGPAMLAGIALIPLACRTLAEAAAALGLSAEQQAQAVLELCRGAGAAGMVGGQLLDLEAEGVSLPLESLRRVHALKTGALFRASLRIGGILAGADPGVTDALGRFGDGLGLAFQVTDDVLDETMDADALGKTPGKDRDAHKSTFVSLLGVDGARAAAGAEAESASAALRGAGIISPLLEALAEFAVCRDR